MPFEIQFKMKEFKLKRLKTKFKTLLCQKSPQVWILKLLQLSTFLMIFWQGFEFHLSIEPKI